MKQLLILLALFTTLLGVGKKNFSFSNLDSVPSFERYTFQGKSTKYEKMPVTIEYERLADEIWETRGFMIIADKQITERYLINEEDLLVTEYWRDITFPRGTTKNHSEINVNTQTDDPEEFIISSIPALLYLLRTFPFSEDIDKIMVRAPSQKKGHLNLRIKNRGLKMRDVPAFGEIEVYHVEVSIVMPLVGAFLPKLDYYYRNDAQKTLVGMKGLMPGTGNKIDIELKSYSTEK